MTVVAGAGPSLALPARRLPLDRVQVMGIVNRTPDSFYVGARHHDLHQALDRSFEMIEQGADIIDVGGEKAGPGAPISADEELERVIPVIEGIRRESAVPISVDTVKPAVARAAVTAGADIINSITGFQDPMMRRTAAETGAAIVIMHIQGQPRVENRHPQYDDVPAEVLGFLRARIAECLAEGIAPDRIIIDPGPGFGKSPLHDLAIIRHLAGLTALPYPVLLAVSRKGFIGEVLGTAAEDRLEGSLAVAAWGTLQGVKIVRTHDVQATKRVITMVEAVLRPEAAEERE